MQVHGALLLVSLALLPILPAPTGSPAVRAIPPCGSWCCSRATIGLPYFLLSSTSPLLQAWYVRNDRSQCSLPTLRAFEFRVHAGSDQLPFLVEPNLTSREQAWGWSRIFVAVRDSLRHVAVASRAGAEAGQAAPEADACSSRRRGCSADGRVSPRLTLWVSLAACASMLLVSITNHLSQNVAPIPLLWVLPLALYLLSFILASKATRSTSAGFSSRCWRFSLAFISRAGACPPKSHCSASKCRWPAWRIRSLRDAGNTHIRIIIPLFAVGSLYRVHGLPWRACPAQALAALSDAVLSDGFAGRRAGRRHRGHCRAARV